MRDGSGAIAPSLGHPSWDSLVSPPPQMKILRPEIGQKHQCIPTVNGEVLACEGDELRLRSS